MTQDGVGNDELVVYYRNYRDEVRVRRIRPVRWWFGKTQYHPDPGWICTAVDLDRTKDKKPVVRDFALTGMLAIGREAVESYQAFERAMVASLTGG